MIQNNNNKSNTRKTITMTLPNEFFVHIKNKKQLKFVMQHYKYYTTKQCNIITLKRFGNSIIVRHILNSLQEHSNGYYIHINNNVIVGYGTKEGINTFRGNIPIIKFIQIYKYLIIQELISSLKEKLK